MMGERLSNFFNKITISEERADEVSRLVSEGSEPHIGFYALIAASAVIASLGLVLSSAAVVIGAMLVSPLMTPIFGIGLAMVRGDWNLFLRSLRAEIGGIALAIIFGMLFGLLPLGHHPTPEILSRMHPNLLDLMVAVFAGLAGTWAMVDARISPVLPGVAISTAIIPPLAVCGICLANGATSGAHGAFLLFLANLFSILLVSCLIFWKVGMTSKGLSTKGQRLLPRVTLMLICFLVVAAHLTHSLIKVIDRRERMRVAREVLVDFQDEYPPFILEKLRQRETDGSLVIVARILTQAALSPARVALLQEEMKSRVGMPVRLLVRCIITADVSPTGSWNARAEIGFDGIELAPRREVDAIRAQAAEQAMREALKDDPSLEMQKLEVIHVRGFPTVVATVESNMQILPEQVGKIQEKIRRYLDDPRIRLVVRNIDSVDITPGGRVLFGESLPTQAGKDTDRIIEATRLAVEDLGTFYTTTVIPEWKRDHWKIYIEVVGDRVINQSEIKRVEERVSGVAKYPVDITASSKAALVVTRSHNMSTEDFRKHQSKVLKKE